MADGVVIRQEPSASRHGSRRDWSITRLLTSTLLGTVLSYGETPDQRTIDFLKDVAPILETHCVECHGPEAQKGKLRLDRPQYILTGGNSGEPLFLRGNAQESYLIQLVSGTIPDLTMPAEGPPLDQDKIDILKQWINQGAILPKTNLDDSGLTTDHWSFQPLPSPRPPTPVHPSAHNPVDTFVFKKLKDMGLQPSEIADRRVLIRRLFLVMHGLPPSQEEIDAFISDPHPDAYRRLVDSVLDSPRYGERWARHWLDVVRYADTNGFETNRERKTAFRYRDYVIDAFNHDKPYDRFILEQLAGDSSGNDVGTGFLVAGPYDIVKSPDINLTLTQRQDELADMVNTTGTAFLGLTLGCARCHNHKFDPILQKDYYAIQAVFAGVNHGERNLKQMADPDSIERLNQLQAQRAAAEEALNQLRLQVASRQSAGQQPLLRAPVYYQRNEESFPSIEAQFIRFTVSSTTNGAEPCIDELEVYDATGENLALASRGTKSSASGTLPGFPIHKLEHINDGQTGNSWSWISDTRGRGWVQLELPKPRLIQRVVWGRDRTGAYADRLATDYSITASLDEKQWQVLATSEDRAPFNGKTDPNAFVVNLNATKAAIATELIEKSDRLGSEINALRNGPRAWVANFSQPPTTHRLYRGEPSQKREAVAPDALTVMGSLGMGMDEPEDQRRLKFARWIANKNNPLTARVLVNRLWHYIFGRGIAETPSDLGVNGSPPSHSDLLDWLARELIASDWSIKYIQRLILMSHTFQQSSQPRPNAIEMDAGSKFLWRFPPRRLEAEAIRDCILAVSGELDLRQGGPGFYLHRVQVENVMHYFPKESFGPNESRRMVYLFKIRQEQDAIFGAFDCPDGNQTIPRRSRSNTPLQALNLFNSSFVLQQADRLAQRLTQEAGTPVDAQIKLAFQLFYARPPDAFELETSAAMIRAEGLQHFCRALYNTSEFLFVF